MSHSESSMLKSELSHNSLLEMQQCDSIMEVEEGSRSSRSIIVIGANVVAVV